jgi:hypothetical protein
MSSKLRNIEALNKMLDGSHRTQTRKTYSADLTPKPQIIRNVGDVWEEVHPITGIVTVWEQKQGFRVKKSAGSDSINAHRDLMHFPNCEEDCEKKRIGDFGHGDKIMNRKTGRCIDCQAKFEGALKYAGKFNEYAKEKMKSNAESFFKDADVEVEKIVETFKDVNYANEDGSLDKYDMVDPEAYTQHILEEYNKFKHQILDSFDEQPS